MSPFIQHWQIGFHLAYDHVRKAKSNQINGIGFGEETQIHLLHNSSTMHGQGGEEREKGITSDKDRGGSQVEYKIPKQRNTV